MTTDLPLKTRFDKMSSTDLGVRQFIRVRLVKSRYAHMKTTHVLADIILAFENDKLLCLFFRVQKKNLPFVVIFRRITRKPETVNHF